MHFVFVYFQTHILHLEPKLKQQHINMQQTYVNKRPYNKGDQVTFVWINRNNIQIIQGALF